MCTPPELMVVGEIGVELRDDTEGDRVAKDSGQQFQGFPEKIVPYPRQVEQDRPPVSLFVRFDSSACTCSPKKIHGKSESQNTPPQEVLSRQGSTPSGPRLEGHGVGPC